MKKNYISLIIFLSTSLILQATDVQRIYPEASSSQKKISSYITERDYMVEATESFTDYQKKPINMRFPSLEIMNHITGLLYPEKASKEQPCIQIALQQNHDILPILCHDFYKYLGSILSSKEYLKIKTNKKLSPFEARTTTFKMKYTLEHYYSILLYYRQS